MLNGTFEHDAKSGRITADQLATVATEGVVVGGQRIEAWAAKGESHAQVAAEIRSEIQDSAPSTAHAVETAAIQRTLASPDGRVVMKAIIAVGFAAYIGGVCITLDLSRLSCLALGVFVAGLGEYIESGPCGQGYYFDFPKVWKSHCGA
jgi:hypothetical protein